MHRLFVRIERFLHHPWVRIAIALSLVVSSVFEIMEELGGEPDGMGSHHGVLIFGVAMVFRASTEVMLEFIETHHAFEGQKRSPVNEGRRRDEH